MIVISDFRAKSGATPWAKSGATPCDKLPRSVSPGWGDAVPASPTATQDKPGEPHSTAPPARASREDAAALRRKSPFCNFERNFNITLATCRDGCAPPCTRFGRTAIRNMPARDFPNRHSGSISVSNGVVFFDPDADFDGFGPVCDILRIAVAVGRTRHWTGRSRWCKLRSDPPATPMDDAAQAANKDPV